MPPLPEPLRKKLLEPAIPRSGKVTPHGPTPIVEVCSLCYGHTGDDITPDTTKTPAQCDALQASDMRQVFALID